MRDSDKRVMRRRGFAPDGDVVAHVRQRRIRLGDERDGQPRAAHRVDRPAQERAATELGHALATSEATSMPTGEDDAVDGLTHRYATSAGPAARSPGRRCGVSTPCARRPNG